MNGTSIPEGKGQDDKNSSRFDASLAEIHCELEDAEAVKILGLPFQSIRVFARTLDYMLL